MSWHRKAGILLFVIVLALVSSPRASLANSVFGDCKDDDQFVNGRGDSAYVMSDAQIQTATITSGCTLSTASKNQGFNQNVDGLHVYNNLHDADGEGDQYVLILIDPANQKNNTQIDTYSVAGVNNNADTTMFTRDQIEEGVTVEIVILGNPFYFVVQATAVGSNTIKGFTITAGSPPVAATPSSTTTEAAQREATSSLIQNRNNTLLNIQPDIGGFIDGTFADGGGPLGNFGLRGNEAGFNMSFASSMGKVWSEVARNQSLANSRSAAARADNTMELPRQSSAFLYGQSVPKKVNNVTQTSASSVKPKTGDTSTLELEGKENAYGSTAKVENTSQLAQARERGYDLWVQVYGAKAHAGNSDSTIWVGYAGAHRFINDNLILGGVVQLDWSDESNDTNGSSADGFGWMVGPYIATKLPDQNLFFDARAAYGRSDNDINLTTSTGSFQTERWLVSAKVSGLLQDGDWDIRPAIGVSYFEETQESYTDSTNTVIGSQTFTLGEVRFGPTFSHTMIAADGRTIKPRFGVNGVWNFSIKNGASSQGAALGNGDLRARLDIGVTILDAQAWSLDLSGFYDGIGINNYYAYGGKARLTVPLN